jgi:hypothetical protein
MSALPDKAGLAPPKSVRAYIWSVGRFALGYILAVAAGAIIIAVLLELMSNFEALHFPHGGTPEMFDKIFELIALCFVLGAMFGLPYTILGSLAFWFLLPRERLVFLLIGTFCPLGALLTMSLVFQEILGLETAVVLSSLPAGLIAAYVYGAIGFSQGFGRWRFA